MQSLSVVRTRHPVPAEEPEEGQTHHPVPVSTAAAQNHPVVPEGTYLVPAARTHHWAAEQQIHLVPVL